MDVKDCVLRQGLPVRRKRGNTQVCEGHRLCASGVSLFVDLTIAHGAGEPMPFNVQTKGVDKKLHSNQKTKKKR